MPDSEEIVVMAQAGNGALQLWIDNVDSLSAGLANGMVVMWGEYFAELYMTPQALPDTIHDAQPFKQYHGSIHGSSIKRRSTFLRQSCSCDWPGLA